MDTAPTGQILASAYTLDPGTLDEAARHLGREGWTALVPELVFEPWDTGGGCMMLVADVPGVDGYRVGITDGEAEVPTQADTFWVGLLDPDGEELYVVQVMDGRLMGSLQ
ncbi:hypothetical protein QOL99_11580 [Deinococcus sp. MIMF12]|uniref:Uncharacterized protein n=1 Tax=Deinococcus rhizophilus TaxID=3049544 RepID=A0ABT7JIM1_9DEIO|nr:hypothetical protein [Deinococcus rhizophilus]MDL2344786.1 hypothetical protein [Deinococcus rhizophilus]